MRNVVEHVLQRPPKVGKAAADQLFKEVQSEYFPTDPKQALAVLSRGPLARPKENLLKEFVLGITSAALMGDLPVLEIIKRYAAITAVSELHRDIFLKVVRLYFPKLLNKTPDAGLKYIFPLVSRIPEIQTAIEPGLRAKLLRCIEVAPTDDLNAVLGGALRIEQFKTAAAERVRRLDENAIAMFITSRRSSIPPQIIDRALEIYFGAISFADANKKAQNLIEMALTSFSREQIIKLLDIAGANGQILHSGGFRVLFRQIRDKGFLSEADIDSEIKRRSWEEDFGQLMSKPEKEDVPKPVEEKPNF